MADQTHANLCSMHRNVSSKWSRIFLSRSSSSTSSKATHPDFVRRMCNGRRSHCHRRCRWSLMLLNGESASERKSSGLSAVVKPTTMTMYSCELCDLLLFDWLGDTDVDGSFLTVRFCRSWFFRDRVYDLRANVRRQHLQARGTASDVGCWANVSHCGYKMHQSVLKRLYRGWSNNPNC